VLRQTIMVAISALVVGCQRRTELPDHLVLTRLDSQSIGGAASCVADEYGLAFSSGKPRWTLSDV